MDQTELLLYILNVLENLDIPYMITGSLASIAYGEWRLTNDIDIVADFREHHTSPFIRSFPSEQFYVSTEGIKDALTHISQFNLIHPSTGYKIDIIILKRGQFSQNEFSRRVKIQVIPGREAFFAKPEDIIIKKLEFYKQGGSYKHLRDIASMIQVSKDELDLFYINEWTKKLGLEDLWNEILRNIFP